MNFERPTGSTTDLIEFLNLRRFLRRVLRHLWSDRVEIPRISRFDQLHLPIAISQIFDLVGVKWNRSCCRLGCLNATSGRYSPTTRITRVQRRTRDRRRQTEKSDANINNAGMNPRASSVIELVSGHSYMLAVTVHFRLFRGHETLRLYCYMTC